MTITAGTGLDHIEIAALAGDDNVNLTGFTAVRAQIYGGDGNDIIRGSDLSDIIYGGAGNDILIGGIGSDTQYGEEGNDTFGNPSLAADGTSMRPLPAGASGRVRTEVTSCVDASRSRTSAPNGAVAATAIDELNARRGRAAV